MARTVFRIDDRLIHGQVLEGWIHNLNLTRVAIVSERVKNDEEYRRILEFSVPPEIKVDIFSIREMAEKIKGGYTEEEDTIVLFENTSEVLELLDYGVRIESLNVGCLHYNGSNLQVRKSIAVTDKDINNFKDIDSMGTQIECRALPQDRKVDLVEIINKIK
ncbi:MAG: PTS sugar transporter subunit IIB [Elusimicrobia bacterium]|nr:PTS sugar transporter subunit IIB [Elusimicrobiota bacterium]